MMTCRELAEALGDIVADELPPDRRQQAQLHLDGCADCVAILESYRLTIRLARRLTPPALPAGLLARLRAGLEGGAPAAAE
jgi:hypothetical protein